MPDKVERGFSKKEIMEIRGCSFKNQKWMGAGQSFSTMTGFTGTHNTWQNCLPVGTFPCSFRVTAIFLYESDEDYIIRFQICFGANPDIQYAAGEYTEKIIKSNGHSEILISNVTHPKHEGLDCWIRPIIGNEPDATIKFFLGIQSGEWPS